MIDIKELAIGGVLIVPFIIGWVELTKKLGVKGVWCIIEAIAFGGLFSGLAAAIQMELVPLLAIPWIKVVTIGLYGALVCGGASAGLFDLLKKLFGIDVPTTVVNNHVDAKTDAARLAEDIKRLRAVQ